MPLDSTRHIPANATAGLTFGAWYSLRCFSDPAFLISATLMLRGPAVIDIAGVVNGDALTFTADAETTGAWAPGKYWYSLRVSGSSATSEVANGQIEILPDFAGLPAGYDGRTENETALDAISAVLAKRATQDQQRYTIGDRELWRTPMVDLIKLRAFYATKVRQEQAAASGHSRFGRPIVVRFR